MSEAASMAWVTAPVSLEVKRVIRLAAAKEDLTIAEFLRRAALDRAAAIERQEAGATGREVSHGSNGNP